MRYVDSLSRWKGHNAPGNRLLREHLELAYSTGTSVRLVIARTNDEAAVTAGGDASKLENAFGIREDLMGRVTSFDGDNFVIEFRKK
jgi:hypothetical protein